MMIRILDKVFIFLFFFSLALFPLISSAHGAGASIEEVVDGYLVDIGYSPVVVVAGTQVRLDFLLYEAETSEEVAFTDVWLRIEDDEKLLFAGAVAKSEYGATGVSYSFPKEHDYTIFVRYSNEGEAIVEHEVTLPVLAETVPVWQTGVPLWMFIIVVVLLLVLLCYAGWQFFFKKSELTAVSDSRQSKQKFNFAVIKDNFGSVVVIIAAATITFMIADWYLSRSETDQPMLSTVTSEEIAGDVEDVVLTESGFESREVTIPVGTTIRFSTNTGRPFWPASNLHPTHAIYSEFDPKEPVAPDKTWSFTFDKAGNWDMHDHIRSYFTGTITVVEE